MDYIITEDQHRRLKKLIERFLESKNIDGICGFWVDDETEPDASIWVYIILDSGMLEGTNPDFVVKRYKLMIKSEIESVFGINVTVGTIVKNCSEEK